MTEELKPCPFCGGQAQLTRTRDIAQYFYAECSVCYSRNLAKPSRQKAADFWNNRVQNHFIEEQQ